MPFLAIARTEKYVTVTQSKVSQCVERFQSGRTRFLDEDHSSRLVSNAE
jgi:hypothetical protein